MSNFINKTDNHEWICKIIDRSVYYVFDLHHYHAGAKPRL